MVEIGTLVYVKNRERLYKYIAFRPDTNNYVLELSEDIYPGTKIYLDISKKEFDQNAVFEKNIYTHLINERINEYRNMINECETKRVDNSLLNNKLTALKKEIDTLQKIEDKTVNQIASIKQLEKAIRRQESKIRSNSRKFDDKAKSEIWEYQRNIDTLNLAYRYVS